MQISATIMKSGMEIPQKAKNRTAIWSSDTTPRHIYKGTSLRIQQRHLYTNVYHSNIHNSQDKEKTQMPQLMNGLRKLYI
jgi:hypothetical protein